MDELATFLTPSSRLDIKMLALQQVYKSFDTFEKKNNIVMSRCLACQRLRRA